MYTVVYYPPAREDVHTFFCNEKPVFSLSEESGLHTLMVTFAPTNGPVRNTALTVPAAHCLVETVEVEAIHA